MSEAVSAINTLLQFGNGASPESWTTIANVSSINGPTISVNVVDITSHSNADAFRRKRGTLIDPGEITFELFFDPSEDTHSAATGVLGDLLNRVSQHFRLNYPAPVSGFYIIFTGQITNFSLSHPVDGVVSANVTITISGPIQTVDL